MALVNNGELLGKPNKDLVLETAGHIYIKVRERYYELDFESLAEGKLIGRSITQQVESDKEPEIDLSDYVTNDDLKRQLKKYVTNRSWQDLMDTQAALENSLLEGFTESIKPITVQTMQLVVGSEQLQFDWIKNLSNDTRLANDHIFTPKEDSSKVLFDPGYIKHWTMDGPKKVIDAKEGTDEAVAQRDSYWRWHIDAPSNWKKSKLEGYTDFYEVPIEEGTTYVYLKVPVGAVSNFGFNEYGKLYQDVEGEAPCNEGLKKGCNFWMDPKDELKKVKGSTSASGLYAKTGEGEVVLSTVAIPMCGEDTSGYKPGQEFEYADWQDVATNPYRYFLYAIITNSDGTPSIATMNGFTEITPGVVRAYIFATPDGKSFLNFENNTMRLGDNLHYDGNNLYLNGALVSDSGGHQEYITIYLGPWEDVSPKHFCPGNTVTYVDGDGSTGTYRFIGTTCMDDAQNPEDSANWMCIAKGSKIVHTAGLYTLVCNSSGISVPVDDSGYTRITKEDFAAFNLTLKEGSSALPIKSIVVDGSTVPSALTFTPTKTGSTYTGDIKVGIRANEKLNQSLYQIKLTVTALKNDTEGNPIVLSYLFSVSSYPAPDPTTVYGFTLRDTSFKEIASKNALLGDFFTYNPPTLYFNAWASQTNSKHYYNDLRGEDSKAAIKIEILKEDNIRRTSVVTLNSSTTTTILDKYINSGTEEPEYYYKYTFPERNTESIDKVCFTLLIDGEIQGTAEVVNNRVGKNGSDGEPGEPGDKIGGTRTFYCANNIKPPLDSNLLPIYLYGQDMWDLRNMWKDTPEETSYGPDYPYLWQVTYMSVNGVWYLISGPNNSTWQSTRRLINTVTYYYATNTIIDNTSIEVSQNTYDGSCEVFTGTLLTGNKWDPDPSKYTLTPELRFLYATTVSIYKEPDDSYSNERTAAVLIREYVPPGENPAVLQLTSTNPFFSFHDEGGDPDNPTITFTAIHANIPVSELRWYKKTPTLTSWSYIPSNTGKDTYELKYDSMMQFPISIKVEWYNHDLSSSLDVVKHVSGTGNTFMVRLSNPSTDIIKTGNSYDFSDAKTTITINFNAQDLNKTFTLMEKDYNGQKDSVTDVPIYVPLNYRGGLKFDIDKKTLMAVANSCWKEGRHSIPITVALDGYATTVSWDVEVDCDGSVMIAATPCNRFTIEAESPKDNRDSYTPNKIEISATSFDRLGKSYTGDYTWQYFVEDNVPGVQEDQWVDLDDKLKGYELSENKDLLTLYGTFSVFANRNYITLRCIDSTLDNDWDYLTIDYIVNNASNYKLDLTNDSATVNCDKDGNILGKGSLQNSSAILYYGNDPVDSNIGDGTSIVTYEIDNLAEFTGLSITTEGRLVFGDNFNFNGDSAGIVITAKIDGSIKGTAVMSITKLYPSADGAPATSVWLVLQPSSISVRRDKSDAQTHVVKVSMMKQTGDDEPEAITDANYKWYYRKTLTSGDQKEWELGGAGADGSITVVEPANVVFGDTDDKEYIAYIDVELRKNNKVLDNESIPVLRDGEKGTDSYSFNLNHSSFNFYPGSKDTIKEQLSDYIGIYGLKGEDVFTEYETTVKVLDITSKTVDYGNLIKIEEVKNVDDLVGFKLGGSNMQVYQLAINKNTTKEDFEEVFYNSTVVIDITVTVNNVVLAILRYNATVIWDVEGEKGPSGVTTRVRQWIAPTSSNGVQYCDGTTTDMDIYFLDFVYYKGQYYKCLKYQKYGLECPIPGTNSTYWQMIDNREAVAMAYLIIGEKGQGWTGDKGEFRHTDERASLNGDGSIYLGNRYVGEFTFMGNYVYKGNTSYSANSKTPFYTKPAGISALYIKNLSSAASLTIYDKSGGLYTIGPNETKLVEYEGDDIDAEIPFSPRSSTATTQQPFMIVPPLSDQTANFAVDPYGNINMRGNIDLEAENHIRLSENGVERLSITGKKFTKEGGEYYFENHLSKWAPEWIVDRPAFVGSSVSPVFSTTVTKTSDIFDYNDRLYYSIGNTNNDPLFIAKDDDPNVMTINFSNTAFLYNAELTLTSLGSSIKFTLDKVNFSNLISNYKFGTKCWRSSSSLNSWSSTITDVFTASTLYSLIDIVDSINKSIIIKANQEFSFSIKIPASFGFTVATPSSYNLGDSKVTFSLNNWTILASEQARFKIGTNGLSMVAGNGNGLIVTDKNILITGKVGTDRSCGFYIDKNGIYMNPGIDSNTWQRYYRIRVDSNGFLKIEKDSFYVDLDTDSYWNNF